MKQYSWKCTVFPRSKFVNVYVSEWPVQKGLTPQSYTFPEGKFPEESKYDKKIVIKAKGVEL